MKAVAYIVLAFSSTVCYADGTISHKSTVRLGGADDDSAENVASVHTMDVNPTTHVKTEVKYDLKVHVQLLDILSKLAKNPKK